MNTPYPPLPSHTIIPIDAATLLLVVETRGRPNYDLGQHAYMRFPNLFPGEALILGVSPNTLCEVLKVRWNQAFRIVSWKDGTKTLVTCIVTSDLSVRLLNQDEKTNGTQSLETDLCLDDQLLNPPINDEELMLLFSAQWPDWLQPSLTAQLRYWQLHNVDLYFRFSPWPVDRSDLWKCVKAAPQEALRKFAPLLDGRQKNICFEKAPDAAAEFAFDYLSTPLRRRAISLFPHKVVSRHAKILTEAEVGEMKSGHPGTVFRLFTDSHLPQVGELQQNPNPVPEPSAS